MTKKSKIIFFSLLLIIITIVAPTGTRALVKPNLFTSGSSVAWTDNGIQLKSTDVGNLFIPLTVAGSIIEYHPEGRDTTVCQNCCVKDDLLTFVKLTGDNKPKEVGYYKYIGTDPGTWKTGVTSVSWTLDDGVTPGANCEYGYLYTLSDNNLTNVKIDGDIYSLSNIEGFKGGAKYLGFIGKHLVQSNQDIKNIEEDFVSKISQYPLLGTSSSNYEKLESFENELIKIKNEYSQSIDPQGQFTIPMIYDPNKNGIGKQGEISKYPRGQIFYAANDLTISNKITVDDNTKQIIIAKKDIRISADIEGSVGSIAFVSLKGDITIDPNVTKVDAALVALKHTGTAQNNLKYEGQVIIENGTSKLTLNGLIVSGQTQFKRDPNTFPPGGGTVGTHLIYNKNIEKLPGFTKLINPSVEGVVP